MRKEKSLFNYLIIFLLACSCGSGSVSINSIPSDAELSIVDSARAVKKLGNVGTYSEEKIFNSQKVIQLHISKRIILVKILFYQREYFQEIIMSLLH